MARRGRLFLLKSPNCLRASRQLLSTKTSRIASQKTQTKNTWIKKSRQTSLTHKWSCRVMELSRNDRLTTSTPSIKNVNQPNPKREWHAGETETKQDCSSFKRFSINPAREAAACQTQGHIMSKIKTKNHINRVDYKVLNDDVFIFRRGNRMYRLSNLANNWLPGKFFVLINGN